MSLDPLTPSQVRTLLGKADWRYERDDPEYPGTNVLEGMHIPCCSVLVKKEYWGSNKLRFPMWRPCGNGPLTGMQIVEGDCGEHAEVTSQPFTIEDPVQPKTLVEILAEEEADDLAAEIERESFSDPRCGCPDHYATCSIHGPSAPGDGRTSYCTTCREVSPGCRPGHCINVPA